MAQTKKRRKKRKNRSGDGTGAPIQSSGVMQGIAGGFRTMGRSVIGGSEKKTTSKLENIVWGIVLVCLLGYVIYTYTK